MYFGILKKYIQNFFSVQIKQEVFTYKKEVLSSKFISIIDLIHLLILFEI